MQNLYRLCTVCGVRNQRLATLEDRDLVNKVVDGDVHAFEEIYDRYNGQVFALALRVTGSTASR